MAKAACKCKKPDECEECPEWIFTFADLVMLMMGFFVILWVLKPSPGKDGQQDQALPVEVLAAIREAFGYLPDPNSKDPVDAYLLMKKLEQMDPRKGQGKGGQTELERTGVRGADELTTSIRPGKLVARGAPVQFAAGSTELDATARTTLADIAKQIRGHRNIVLVRGHTSLADLPESADSQQKLDLSIRRAKTVADHLVELGVAPETLRVLGCSTFEPVVHRVLSAKHVTNARVEVQSTDTLVEDNVGSTTRPAGPAIPAPRATTTRATTRH